MQNTFYQNDLNAFPFNLPCAIMSPLPGAYSGWLLNRTHDLRHGLLIRSPLPWLIEKLLPGNFCNPLAFNACK